MTRRVQIHVTCLTRSGKRKSQAAFFVEHVDAGKLRDNNKQPPRRGIKEGLTRLVLVVHDQIAEEFVAACVNHAHSPVVEPGVGKTTAEYAFDVHDDPVPNFVPAGKPEE